VGRLATVLQALVPHERPGEDLRFAEDLEPIARAQDEPALGHELGQGLDHGRAAGHGARAQVVAVGEAARKNQTIKIVELPVPVPDVADGLAEDLADDVMEITVTPRPGKHHHAEVHGAEPSSLNEG